MDSETFLFPDEEEQFNAAPLQKENHNQDEENQRHFLNFFFENGKDKSLENDFDHKDNQFQLGFRPLATLHNQEQANVKSGTRKIPITKSLSFAGFGVSDDDSTDFDSYNVRRKAPRIMKANDLQLNKRFKNPDSNEEGCHDSNTVNIAEVTNQIGTSPPTCFTRQLSADTPSSSHIKYGRKSKFQKHKSISFPVDDSFSLMEDDFADQFFDWSTAFQTPALSSSNDNVGSKSIVTPDSGFCTPNQECLSETTKNTPGQQQKLCSEYSRTQTDFDGVHYEETQTPKQKLRDSGPPEENQMSKPHLSRGLESVMMPESPLSPLSMTPLPVIKAPSTSTLSDSSNKESCINSQERKALEELQLNKTTKSPQQKRYERPGYSYSDLIRMALKSSKHNALSVKEILTWIENKFPYFKHEAKKSWKSSVRHNLTIHPEFKKVNERKHGGKWTVAPVDFHDQLRKALPLPSQLRISATADAQLLANSTKKLKRIAPQPILPKAMQSYALVPLPFSGAATPRLLPQIQPAPVIPTSLHYNISALQWPQLQQPSIMLASGQSLQGVHNFPQQPAPQAIPVKPECVVNNEDTYLYPSNEATTSIGTGQQNSQSELHSQSELPEYDIIEKDGKISIVIKNKAVQPSNISFNDNSEPNHVQNNHVQSSNTGPVNNKRFQHIVSKPPSLIRRPTYKGDLLVGKGKGKQTIKKRIGKTPPVLNLSSLVARGNEDRSAVNNLMKSLESDLKENKVNDTFLPNTGAISVPKTNSFKRKISQNQNLIQEAWNQTVGENDSIVCSVSGSSEPLYFIEVRCDPTAPTVETPNDIEYDHPVDSECFSVHEAMQSSSHDHFVVEDIKSDDKYENKCVTSLIENRDSLPHSASFYPTIVDSPSQAIAPSLQSLQLNSSLPVVANSDLDSKTNVSSVIKCEPSSTSKSNKSRRKQVHVPLTSEVSPRPGKSNAGKYVNDNFGPEENHVHHSSLFCDYDNESSKLSLKDVKISQDATNVGLHKSLVVGFDRLLSHNTNSPLHDEEHKTPRTITKDHPFQDNKINRDTKVEPCITYEQVHSSPVQSKDSSKFPSNENNFFENSLSLLSPITGNVNCSISHSSFPSPNLRSHTPIQKSCHAAQRLSFTPSSTALSTHESSTSNINSSDTQMSVHTNDAHLLNYNDSSFTQQNDPTSLQCFIPDDMANRQNVRRSTSQESPTQLVHLPSDMLQFHPNSSSILDSSLFDNIDKLMQNSFDMESP